MYCNYCGKQLDADAAFCGSCGNRTGAQNQPQQPVVQQPQRQPLPVQQPQHHQPPPMHQPQQPPLVQPPAHGQTGLPPIAAAPFVRAEAPQTKPKSKVAVICIVAAVAVLAVVLFLGTDTCGTADMPLSAAELLTLGERYLLDLNFEQALVQFLALIDVEPRNPRGYTGAADAYVGLGQYEEAIAILEQGLEELPGEESIITALNLLDTGFGLAPDDSVFAEAPPEPPQDLVPFPEFSPQYSLVSTTREVMALRTDGTVVSTNYEHDLSYWTDIVALFQSGTFYGLKADGTVVTTRNHGPISHWTDIRYICGRFALRSDGTIVTHIANWHPNPDAHAIDHWGQYRGALSELSGVRNINSVGHNTVIATKYDGTVSVIGPQAELLRRLFYERTDFVDIMQFTWDHNATFLLVLWEDGTIDSTFIGSQADAHKYSVEGVEDWTDVIAIASASRVLSGLRRDGTVYITGSNPWGAASTEFGLSQEMRTNVESWTDIREIVMSGNHIVGLRSDGTTVSAGRFDFSTPDVSSWTNVISIRTGQSQEGGRRFRNTIGLKSDGTVVAYGPISEYVDGWTDIMTTPP